MKQTTDKGVKTYKRLLSFLKPHLPVLFLGLASGMLAGLVDSGLAWLLKPIVNKGFVVRDMAFIAWLPSILVAAMLIRSSVNFLSDYCINRVGRTMTMEFRERVFEKLLKLPVQYFDLQSSGKILSTIIYNVEQIAEATTFALLTVVKDGFLLLGMVSVMLVLSWKLTLFFCVAGPVVGFILKKNSLRLRKISHQVQSSVGEVTHISEEAIEGYKVIRTFGGEDYETKRFGQAVKDNRHRELKAVIANSIGSAGVQIVLTIPIAFILYFVTSDKIPAFSLSAGTFAAFMAAALSVERPFRRLTRVNALIQKGVAAAQSIFLLLDEKEEIDKGALPLKRAKGAIEYRKVSFSYSSADSLVLNQISFKAEPGQVIALVGRSGSGKSTLVNLLPRFYNIHKGEICLDGQNIQDYRLSDLRQQFSMVSQHVMLFNASIADNIRYGSFDRDEASIIRAARAAHAWEFIKDLPQGLNTPVGENGILLSGGQRQRLAIARALLKKAPVLILDEATSALDNESEQFIQGALKALMKHCTTLVIAHRLSTVEHADCILVLEQGRIVESGSHAQLIDRGGAYTQLYRMQFKEAAMAES